MARRTSIHDGPSFKLNVGLRRSAVLQCKNEAPECVASKRFQEFIDYSGDLIYNKASKMVLPYSRSRTWFGGLESR